VAQRNGACKPSFGMISNGVKMTPRLFDIIQKYEIQVTFSLDGPKKVNDLVRIRHDDSGTFDAVVANIHRYREVFPEKAQVECTVTQAHRDAGLSLTEVLDFLRERSGCRRASYRCRRLTGYQSAQSIPQWIRHAG
jgi:uncharacterized protein